MSALYRIGAPVAVLLFAACAPTTSSSVNCMADALKAPRGFAVTTASDPSPAPQPESHARSRPYHQVYVAVYIAALNAASLLSWNIETLDPETGVIQVKTPDGLWASGRRVTLRVARQDSATTVVNVTAAGDEPMDPAGERKIQTFFDRLDRDLGRPAGS